MASKKEVVDDDVLPVKESWTDFVYNSNKGTFLGRTGLSWLKIGVFYAIFYACLAGWFAGLLNAFYSSLDEVAPTYYGQNSLLQDNPAMGMRPMPFYDSTLIRFAQGKESSYRPYMDHLDSFFKNYEYNPDALNCTDGVDSTDSKACNIPAHEYLEILSSTRDEGYGYFKGEPVVAIKMNKLFGFKPTPYSSLQAIKDDLKDGEVLNVTKLAYSPGNIGISCDGQNALDRQLVRGVTFAPSGGLSTKYFPYKNQVGYRSPLVLAKFSLEKKVTIQVTCKLWATNIDNSDGKKKKGTVHFEFYIE